MDNTVWVHNLDPFLIQISGNFGIRWYSLAYLSGFALAFFFMTWMSKHKRSPLTPEQVSDFLTYLILGVLLGGRFGYVLFYSPDLLTDFRSDFPFWGALAVWEGGMASHGGFLGVFIACILFAWRNKMDPFHLGDLTITGATFGIFLGRIANFMNGELMGRVAPADLPWAVKFPQDAYRWIGYEPERLSSLTNAVKELGISSSQWSNWLATSARGQMYATVDKIIAAIRDGNEKVTEAMAQVLEPRHPSQLYGSFLEGLLPLIIICIIWFKPRKPGLIAGVYFLVYSASRVFDEMYRLPDAHLSDLSQLPLGLTRGQFLSLFIFAVGLALVIISQRRKVDKMGGLPLGKS